MQVWLGGNAGKRTSARAKPAQGPVAPVEMPAELPEAERGVWRQLAPHALEARTLTVGTAAAFRDLCELIVWRRKMSAQIEQDGTTYVKVSVDGAGVEHQELKKHPLLTEYRGLQQRVEAGMSRFRLSPMGKPMVEAPEKPADPFAEFEAPGAVQ